MRGVELGITLDEFRRIPVIVDETRFSSPSIHCTGEDLTGLGWSARPDGDTKLGILSCAWFVKFPGITGHNLYSSPATISLGSGKGDPTFQFVEKRGEKRLFRIKFFAHTSYGEGIVDALTRNFGAPAQTVRPFQVLSGSTFTATTSVWTNGVSTISFTTPCDQLNRYCLTYDHTELKQLYNALLHQRDAAAASKI